MCIVYKLYVIYLLNVYCIHVVCDLPIECVLHTMANMLYATCKQYTFNIHVVCDLPVECVEYYSVYAVYDVYTHCALCCMCCVWMSFVWGE